MSVQYARRMSRFRAVGALAALLFYSAGASSETLFPVQECKYPSFGDCYAFQA